MKLYILCNILLCNIFGQCLLFTILKNNFQKNIIINLDDLIDYHYTEDIAELMTQISPIISNYKKIEFAITKEKLDEIVTNKICTPQLKFTSDKYKSLNNFGSSLYHEYAVRQLKHLGNKINCNFSIIYVENILIENEITENKLLENKKSVLPKIAIDYYISKIATKQNNNGEYTQVVKNCDHSGLKLYWDLSIPIKILQLQKKYISLYSINQVHNLDTNFNWSNVKDFLI